MENQQNNTQNGYQPNWFDRNKWFLFAVLIVALLCWKNFHLETGFSELSSSKKDSSIVKAIDNSTNKIVGAINDNGNKLGDKVDKNTEAINNGSVALGDSIFSLKKACISCREKSHKPKCGPNKKKVETPKPAQDTTKVVKPKPAPCCVEKPIIDCITCKSLPFPSDYKKYNKWETLDQQGCYGFKSPFIDGEIFKFKTKQAMHDFWYSNPNYFGKYTPNNF